MQDLLKAPRQCLADNEIMLSAQEMCCTKMVLPSATASMDAFAVTGNGYSPVAWAQMVSMTAAASSCKPWSKLLKDGFA